MFECGECFVFVFGCVGCGEVFLVVGDEVGYGVGWWMLVWV